MLTDALKDILSSDKKRILLYGLPGLGKTYSVMSLSEQNPGGFAVVNFRSDDTTDLISVIRSGCDITEALVDTYRIPAELIGTVRFVLDEFTECDGFPAIEDLMTAPRDAHKYPELGIIYVTSDISWAERYKDRFDATLKAQKIAFDEYLRISDNTWYAQVVEAHMTGKKSMPALIHNELINLYYEYISTGGYPRAVYESVKELPLVYPEDLAAERYFEMLGRIASAEETPAGTANKLQIINTIPECAKNSKFVIARTGRRHISKDRLESDIDDLVNAGLLIRIPRLGSDSYSLALSDDAVYWYLLRKNSARLELSEEKIKELVLENHIRNIFAAQGLKVMTWAGKYRFRINVLIEKDGKYCPVRTTCNKSVRKSGTDEFLNEFGNKTFAQIHFTENTYNESNGTVFMPLYGCEYINTIIPQQ